MAGRLVDCTQRRLNCEPKNGTGDRRRLFPAMHLSMENVPALLSAVEQTRMSTRMHAESNEHMTLLQIINAV